MNRPWYRHLWPWLLISGPAAVLIAGGVTMWIAFTSADGLVADDYYKQGLAINKRLAREETARKLGVVAIVELQARHIRVRLTGDAPPVLFVQLAHATRAGYDMRLRLTPVAAGAYEAELDPLPRGHWRVVIEDPRGTWRIAQEVS
ncbi:MAG TPA: FixH family protein [Burkholderiales bacterium]|nr:FixH family protein [Burkholderiales bacterium]